jgi:hypothetical protein
LKAPIGTDRKATASYAFEDAHISLKHDTKALMRNRRISYDTAGNIEPCGLGTWNTECTVSQTEAETAKPSTQFLHWLFIGHPKAGWRSAVPPTGNLRRGNSPPVS